MELIWSPSLGAHLSNFPADRRELKDVLVRPFAALAVPISAQNGTTIETHLGGIAVLTLLGAALFRRLNRSAGPRSAPAASQIPAVLVIGGVWVLLSALPLLTRFYIAPTLEGGRFLYLPAAGFAILLSAGLTMPRRLVVVPGIALVVLLLFYAKSLCAEAEEWREASRTRDLLIDGAAAIVRTVPCRTIEVLEAPDNIDGAFVFRNGLREALARLPYDSAGESCVARWSGWNQRLHRIE